MSPLAAVDTGEPLDLPLSGAASTAKPAAVIEPSPLGEDGPGGTDRAVTVGPVLGNPVLKRAAGSSEQGERRQMDYRRQCPGIELSRS
jgi:hypothetical protein